MDVSVSYEKTKEKLTSKPKSEESNLTNKCTTNDGITIF